MKKTLLGLLLSTMLLAPAGCSSPTSCGVEREVDSSEAGRLQREGWTCTQIAQMNPGLFSIGSPLRYSCSKPC